MPALQDSDSETNMDLDSPLLVLAQKLLEVESILDSHIQLLGEPVEEVKSEGFIDLSTHEQRRIISRLLDECVNSLHDAQDAIQEAAGRRPRGRFRNRPWGIFPGPCALLPRVRSRN